MSEEGISRTGKEEEKGKSLKQNRIGEEERKRKTQSLEKMQKCRYYKFWKKREKKNMENRKTEI